MFVFLARSNFNSKYNIADSLITDYKVSGEIWGMLVTLTGFILLGQRTGSTLYSAKAFEQLPFLTNGVLMGITGFVYGGLIARFWIRGYSIRKTINKRNKILITILEIVILSYFVNILINCTQKYEKIYYILIFSIIIMDFIYQWGYIAQLLNHKIFGHLGKWSYSIYMMQFPCFAYLKKSLWIKNSAGDSKTILLISVSICVGVGIATYYLIERPLSKWLKKKMLVS